MAQQRHFLWRQGLMQRRKSSNITYYELKVVCTSHLSKDCDWLITLSLSLSCSQQVHYQSNWWKRTFKTEDLMTNGLKYIYFLNAQIWCDLIFINSTKNTYFLVQENIVSMNLQISKYCSKFGVGKIFTLFYIYKSPTQCCMHLIKTTIKINYNNHLNIFYILYLNIF